MTAKAPRVISLPAPLNAHASVAMNELASMIPQAIRSGEGHPLTIALINLTAQAVAAWYDTNTHLALYHAVQEFLAAAQQVKAQQELDDWKGI